MKDSARIAAGIEILDEVFGCAASAELLLRRYLRARRYIGSKDRKSIQELVFGVIRHRGFLEWRLGQAGSQEIEAADLARRMTIAYLALSVGPNRGRTGAECSALFDDAKYAPAPLTPDEQGLIDALTSGEAPRPEAMPDWARLNYPAWLDGTLKASLKDDFEAEMAALNAQAPVDLRVNLIKATRDQALAELIGAGVDATPTRLSPWGIRISERTPWGNLAPYRAGLIEPQDEGSQILALVADARPGQTIVDLCAGAGGKTLAMGALMNNEGRIIATDSARDRLSRTASRLARAGVKNAEIVTDIDTVYRDYAGKADRVLADCPCSGSGTWRRQPAARWCLTQATLSDHLRTQQTLLDRAAGLVKPGGRLIYATCSLLECENSDQAKWFDKHAPGFRNLDMHDIWEAPGDGAAAPYLSLTPARHETDGVFAAVWERIS
ncbi:MAG: RsmB/NOP family class I SAM-dependent RNA methyltransferase [Alphaproteobacteria bacterium]|nr:RsmB/NOP family class I SAM-dependent RNA methyltransferase [Alphaproteobacteria bacterium]